MNKISKNRKAEQTQPKGSGKKWMLLGLGVAATGALSYFGFQYWKKHKQSVDTQADNAPDFSDETQTAYVPPKVKPTATTATPKDSFPLVNGSKGANVKAFQEALISKYGKNMLPKYGADGDFGTEMLTALRKVGMPDSISETAFNILVKGSAPDHTTIARELYTSATTKDFNKAISLLKTLRNTDDYKAVSDTFVNYRIGGVRQTLVNGMLNSFTTPAQKDSIRLAFSNMGLKYDGNKWSLSGLDGLGKVITIQQTQVWKNPRTSVKVPTNMVLGNAITTRGAYTLFENERQYFLVQTQHIKEYN